MVLAMMYGLEVAGPLSITTLIQMVSRKISFLMAFNGWRMGTRTFGPVSASGTDKKIFSQTTRSPKIWWERQLRITRSASIVIGDPSCVPSQSPETLYEYIKRVWMKLQPIFEVMVAKQRGAMVSEHSPRWCCCR